MVTLEPMAFLQVVAVVVLDEECSVRMIGIQFIRIQE